MNGCVAQLTLALDSAYCSQLLIAIATVQQLSWNRSYAIL